MPEAIAKKDDYTLYIHQDTDPLSPREDADNFGTMVCFHKRYSLGDPHFYEDKNDYLLSLLADTLGSEDKAQAFYEKQLDRFSLVELAQNDSAERQIDNALIEAIEQKHVLLPLYLYDHGGITMNTTGFSCPWDSGQVGWIHASKDDILQTFGGQNLTAALRDRAKDLLEKEVACYDSYLVGECYGYELFKADECIDNCWGFMGEREEVKAAIEHCLPPECQGMTKALTSYEEPPKMREDVR